MLSPTYHKVSMLSPTHLEVLHEVVSGVDDVQEVLARLLVRRVDSSVEPGPRHGIKGGLACRPRKKGETLSSRSVMKTLYSEVLM